MAKAHEVKFSEAIGALLSEDNKDKSLGEIGENLSDYLIQIKDLVESGKITYSGLTEEISKYMDSEEIPKPGSVSQLLLGCVEGEDWCPLHEKPADVSYFYDPEKQNFVSISGEDGPNSTESYAIIYLSGDPREIDIDSFKELEEKGFQKVKIRHRDISDALYKEIDITNLERYISSISREGDKENNINGIMSVSFLIIILIILYYMKNTHSGVRS